MKHNTLLSSPNSGNTNVASGGGELLIDLLYFGYEYDNTASNYEKDFIVEVREKFPDVKLSNAYDSIKGYRQEVSLPKQLKDDYLSWLIGAGWFEMSLTMQLMMMDKDQKEQFESIIALAKIQYPKSFKSNGV